MKKQFIIFYVAAFCIVLGLSFAAPASSNILFYEDFEDALDTVADPYRDWSYHSEGVGSMELSTEQVKAGSKAYKFSVTGSASARVRRELTLKYPFYAGSSHFPYGGEYWIGFSIFLAEGYENPSDPRTWGPTHHQYHDVLDGPSTCGKTEYGSSVQPIQIRTIKGDWRTIIGWDDQLCSNEGSKESQYFTHDPYIVGKWIDFVLHIIWDYDDDGLTQVWKDGVLIVNRSGENCYNDVLSPYMKLGIYGWLDKGQIMTIYYDELRIGDSRSSYSEVAPGGSVKPLPPTNVETKKIPSDLTE